MLQDKRITITGGSGFLAQALVPRILSQKPKSVLCMARNEGQLIKMREKFGVDILCGDVADPWSSSRAMQNADIVFDLAAFKHVGIAETQVYECVRSNVIGTMMLLQEALDYPPEMFLFISTDKAAQVKGVYGATKLIGERLVQEAAKLSPQTKFRMVRYGNILYSTGSVLNIWKQALKDGRPLQIADPEMTRFFWTVDQAVDLIFDCMNHASHPEPWLPKMKSAKLGDLLEAFKLKYADPKKTWTQLTTGIGQADNMHETVDGKTFSNEVEHYTVEQLMTMI